MQPLSLDDPLFLLSVFQVTKIGLEESKCESAVSLVREALRSCVSQVLIRICKGGRRSCLACKVRSDDFEAVKAVFLQDRVGCVRLGWHASKVLWA